MRVEYPEAPREYTGEGPIFADNRQITDRVRAGLENVLHAYVAIAHKKAETSDDNTSNYRINRVLIVGSGARENREDSDLDLLLLAPRLDDASAKDMKVILAMIYFTDRPKRRAVDVFVRKEDAFPTRESFDITSQVQELLGKYNAQLASGEN